MQTIPRRPPSKAILLLGSAITVFFWWIAWSKEIPASQYAFFPLWCGYILAINGLSESLYGDSLLKRLGRDFLILFIASAPFWWFFEMLNKFVSNWHYVLNRPISDTRHIIESTIDFTIVLPAVMSTIYFVKIVFRDQGLRFEGRPFSLQKERVSLFAAIGLIGLGLVILFPTLAFPLVWIAPIFLLESISAAFVYPSMLQKLHNGNYTIIASISAATLSNGIVWELWNYYSSPKWLYTIPYVGFLKVFEMPILGYLGYPFFGMIVYNFVLLLYAFIRGIDIAEEIAA